MDKDPADKLIGFLRTTALKRVYSDGPTATASIATKAEEAKRLRAAAEKVEAEIAAEEAAKAAKAERDAFAAQVLADKALIEVGVYLLGDIAALISGRATTRPAEELYAKHRHGLNELARKYGYKLVLVGNRTKAALVLA